MNVPTVKGTMKLHQIISTEAGMVKYCDVREFRFYVQNQGCPTPGPPRSSCPFTDPSRCSPPVPSRSHCPSPRQSRSNCLSPGPSQSHRKTSSISSEHEGANVHASKNVSV